jgi:hypothetical protein
MDKYFDFETFKTTHSLAHSQRQIDKAAYDNTATWAGLTAVCSSSTDISLVANG